MAIIVKELIIKGKVVKDLPDVRIENGLLTEYLRKIKKDIIESCKEQIKNELEREFLK